MVAELSIIIPTYNEIENIEFCINSISKQLTGIKWEIIFVDDDSVDGTSSRVREIARTDDRIRCLQRLGRRGLSSACVDGILSTSSPFICVMDADMQHDEKLIPKMLQELKQEDLDIVIGSRYVDSGSTGKLSSIRVLISKAATIVGGLLLKYPVKDPMSGYFMFKRTYFEQIMYKLSKKGFKILLDMLVSTKGELKFREIPYSMRERSYGESKLDALVVWEFFTLFADKLLGWIFPVRFISFIAVGFSGIFVQLFVLWVLFQIWGASFLPAQGIATFVAMTSNYILNNYITYRDRKLTGMKFIYGLLSFYLACSLGAIINVAFATWLYDQNILWWLASLLGATAGAVWNYAITAMFTWRKVNDF